ncbi:MAG: dCTP deaminase [Desulfovibrio sp.]|jgi:dCTP deaminase|nr:dCTP deaminase [Desulfovibrio sp.]
MSILSDGALIDLILSGELVVKPFVIDHVQPSSIDLCLDTYFKIPSQSSDRINLEEDNSHFYKEEIIEDTYVLKAGNYVLGQLYEYIKIPDDCNGHIYNRSSLARVGLDVASGTYINPGYAGKLTIILKNIGTHDINLTPKRRICQLEINKVNPKPLRTYQQRKEAKYFDEKDSLVSLIHEDSEILDFKKKRGNIGRTELLNFLDNRITEKSEEIVNSLPETLKQKLRLM